MSDPADATSPRPPAAILSELLARKAAARAGRPDANASARQVQRAAAARATAQSKPARRF